MTARDVEPRQEVLVDGDWLLVTFVVTTERDDGTNGVYLYFNDHKPLPLSADDPIEVRTP